MTDTPTKSIKAVKQLVAKADYAEALAALRALARPEDDFTNQHKYFKVLESMPRESLGLRPLRIALVGTSTTDYLCEPLRVRLALDGFDADIHQAEFNTLDQTLLDPAGALYAFDPEIVWIVVNHRDVTPLPEPGASAEEAEACVRRAVERFTGLWDAVARNGSAYVIQSNAALPLERVYGNYEGVAAWGGINALRAFNLALARACRPGVTVLDADYVSALHGKAAWFDERYWNNSRNACSFDAMGLLAHHFSRLVCGIKGLARKCLVLDLDNTLWGGVIGDDGLAGIRLGGSATGEAFVEFQRYCKRLRERGVVLCVCSKNDEDNARQPFLEHPDMVLRLEDIAVFVANWENKADNIRHIAETLEIGLDSLVFVDDNPVERELVASMLPMVAVPEMPEDPAYFVRALDRERCFETVAFSAEDRARADMYRNNAQRKSLQRQFTDINEFLRDLGMRAASADFDDMSLPRVAQLINKSNQFHLTTTRYTEARLRDMMADPATVCRAFKLADKFGDNGLISLVILKPHGDDALIVDTFVMSCRVLSRGMEEFVHNEMVEACRAMGRTRLIGEYRPTKKNRLVADLYERLGFAHTTTDAQGNAFWELAITDDLAPRTPFIERTDW
ncbi:MAG: HAD-IIIC family phosphatase [Desulfovibrionaceae bacterium]|jgi:FkbH-like protein|nr:HAD-IIIC family phosphatase [Desulfovibrionaceae bacterium]